MGEGGGEVRERETEREKFLYIVLGASFTYHREGFIGGKICRLGTYLVEWPINLIETNTDIKAIFPK